MLGSGSFIVYKLTNSANGKVYVGQTTTSLAERWNRHVSYAKLTPDDRKTHLQRAIASSSAGSFSTEELERCGSQQELNAAERRWIEQLRSYDSTVGYNMTLGGDGGERPTTETREKISRKLKEKYASGWVHPMKGKKHSAETKRKLSLASSGENNPMHGVSLVVSAETRSKMSLSKRGEKNSFFGKRHSPETIEKIKETKRKRRNEGLDDT